MFGIGLVIAGVSSVATLGAEASRTHQAQAMSMECPRPYVAVQSQANQWHCVRRLPEPKR
jgi:aminoglycoside phosphotransferase